MQSKTKLSEGSGGADSLSLTSKLLYYDEREANIMKSLRKQLGKESVSGVLFTLPFIIGFILFMIVPMGISLYYSFCDYDILSPPGFFRVEQILRKC